MARLKEAVGAGSYAELGRLLGLTTSAYANRKRSGSIPFEAIAALAHSRKISLDWLIFGVPPQSGEAPRSDLHAQVDEEVLAQVMYALHSAVRPDADAEVRLEFAKLAGVAGAVYNKVAFTDAGESRDAALRQEVQEMASAVRLLEAIEKGVSPSGRTQP